MKKFFLIVLSFSFLTTFILADENSTKKKVSIEKLSAIEEELLKNFRALSPKDQEKLRKQIERTALRNQRQEIKDLEFPFGDLLGFGM
jgi:hypothetical protein